MFACTMQALRRVRCNWFRSNRTVPTIDWTLMVCDLRRISYLFLPFPYLLLSQNEWYLLGPITESKLVLLSTVENNGTHWFISSLPFWAGHIIVCSKALTRQWFVPTLVQVRPCCLTTETYYLDRSWITINKIVKVTTQCISVILSWNSA